MAVIIHQNNSCIKKLKEHCLEMTHCTGTSYPLNFREEVAAISYSRVTECLISKKCKTFWTAEVPTRTWELWDREADLQFYQEDIQVPCLDLHEVQ